MDTSSLVESSIEDGRTLLEQLARDGFDITGAFWVRFKYEEDGPWFYLVSKTVDQKGSQAAFRDVHDSLQRIPLPWRAWFSVSDISELHLVGTNHSLAKELLAFRDRYSGRNRFRGVSIGDNLLEDLYIYPPIMGSDGAGECRRSLTIELPVRTWEKLRDLAATSSQSGAPPLSPGELVAAIIERHVRDKAS